MPEAAPAPTPETPPPAETLGQKVVQQLAADAAQTTAAVETQTGATTEQPKPTLAQRLQAELGFEGVENDEQAVERLVAAYKQQKNEFGTQLQSAIEELRALKQPETPAVETKGQSTNGWNWNPPQVDLQLAATYRTADGWKPETPADLRQAFEARERYVNRFATEFVANPESAIGPLLEKKFAEFFNQQFGQVQAQQQQQSAYEKLVADNAWIYEPDPVSGKPSQKLSAQGNRVNELTAIAQERWGSAMSHAQVLQWALDQFELEKLRSTTTRQTQTQTAQEAAAQQKQAVVNRAAPGLATRNGSIPTATETRSQNRNLSFGERFVQRARAEGVPISR